MIFCFIGVGTIAHSGNE
ncbi:hypothetical protein [Methylobacter sp. BlB1]